jgi:hypothetical protein
LPKKDRELKHCSQGDGWFASVSTANDVESCGCEGIFQMKQHHSIKYALKDAPEGVNIMLEGTAKEEMRSIAKGINTVERLSFIVLTENAGKTYAGAPYKMKWIAMAMCAFVGLTVLI